MVMTFSPDSTRSDRRALRCSMTEELSLICDREYPVTFNMTKTLWEFNTDVTCGKSCSSELIRASNALLHGVRTAEQVTASSSAALCRF